MPSFTGPWCRDLATLKKSTSSIPSKHSATFAATSRAVLEKTCDADALHVWETDSDVDALLQLTSVVAKLWDLGVRDLGKGGKEGGDGGASMVVLVRVREGRDDFGRVCGLVRYLLGGEGKKYLGGAVCAFGGLVVVRGWEDGKRGGGGEKDGLGEVVRRVNISIEKGLKASKGKEIVWHHGPVVHTLLHWINTTTSTLRSSLSAITITGSLDLTTRIGPSAAGKSNTLPDLERLEQYARKLSIPVLFLDAPTQSITFAYLATYMYFFAYYINTFLPVSLSRPHFQKALDDLTTFAFRLYAASHTLSPTATVRAVKSHLDATTARPWARNCISPSSYTKSACLSARTESSIHHAVQLSDCPFAPFSSGPPAAFARLPIGPAAPLASTLDTFIAAPVTISFSTARLRPASPSTLHILLPVPALDEEKATHRIQGLMMGVLERVRQEKGNPVLGSTERAAWSGVVKACGDVLGDVEAGLGKRVGGMVGFVREKMGRGTWGFAVGGSAESNSNSNTNGGSAIGGIGGVGGRGGGVGDEGSGAASANRDALLACAPQFAQAQAQTQQVGGPVGYAVPQGYRAGQAAGGSGGAGAGGYEQNMGGAWY